MAKQTPQNDLSLCDTQELCRQRFKEFMQEHVQDHHEVLEEFKASAKAHEATAESIRMLIKGDPNDLDSTGLSGRVSSQYKTLKETDKRSRENADKIDALAGVPDQITALTASVNETKKAHEKGRKWSWKVIGTLASGLSAALIAIGYMANIIVELLRK
jgi:hypothetical protein